MKQSNAATCNYNLAAGGLLFHIMNSQIIVVLTIDWDLTLKIVTDAQFING